MPVSVPSAMPVTSPPAFFFSRLSAHPPATARVTSCLACASLLSRARADLLVHDGATSWQAVREMGEAAWRAEALRIAYEVADGMAYLHLRYADATVYICRHTPPHHGMTQHTCGSPLWSWS